MSEHDTGQWLSHCHWPWQCHDWAWHFCLFPLSHVDTSPNLQHWFLWGKLRLGRFLTLLDTLLSVSGYLKSCFFIIKIYFPEILILIHLSQKMTFLFVVSVLPKYLKIFLASLLGFFKDFDYPCICLPHTSFLI